MFRNPVPAILLVVLFASCNPKNQEPNRASAPHAIAGTWKLLTGTLIEAKDTTVTDYTRQVSFIKIINDTHFAFLEHDIHPRTDSAVFVAGGGPYSLHDSLYTEHLEYCNSREWEGHDFPFVYSISGDTLILTGREKVENLGVDRINIEKYVRVTQ